MSMLTRSCLLLTSLVMASATCLDNECETVSATHAAHASAMLQVKTSKIDIAAKTSKTESAHLQESRACISAALQEVHVQAIRANAQRLAKEQQTQSPTGESEWKPVELGVGSDPRGACRALGPSVHIHPDQDITCQVNVGSGAAPAQGKCGMLTRGLWWCNLKEDYSCSGNAGNFGSKWNPNIPTIGPVGDACTFRGKEGNCEMLLGGYGNFCNIWPLKDESEPSKPEPETVVVGATASLDAAGFKAVTSLCCPPEMETFFTRLLGSMGLSVCSHPHMQGLMHWFTCVPDMHFQYMLDVIAHGNPCKYWGPVGSVCPALSPQCEGKWCR